MLITSSQFRQFRNDKIAVYLDNTGEKRGKIKKIYDACHRNRAIHNTACIKIDLYTTGLCVSLVMACRGDNGSRLLPKCKLTDILNLDQNQDLIH